MADPKGVHVLGLFAGIGGLELGAHAGLERLGFLPRNVGMVEGEPFGAACLAAAMERGDMAPGPIWLGDVRDFPAARFRGAVDLVVAGFPCQPASTAGKRRGRDDERWLWPIVRDVLSATRPALVFLENVPGLLTVDDGLAFGEVLRDLAGLGFDAEWTLAAAGPPDPRRRVSVPHVGAPHERRRVFVLAYRDDARLGGLGAEDDGPERRDARGDQPRGRNRRLGDAAGAVGGRGERGAEEGAGAPRDWGRGLAGAGGELADASGVGSARDVGGAGEAQPDERRGGDVADALGSRHDGRTRDAGRGSSGGVPSAGPSGDVAHAGHGPGGERAGRDVEALRTTDGRGEVLGAPLPDPDVPVGSGGGSHSADNPGRSLLDDARQVGRGTPGSDGGSQRTQSTGELADADGGSGIRLQPEQLQDEGRRGAEDRRTAVPDAAGRDDDQLERDAGRASAPRMADADDDRDDVRKGEDGPADVGAVAGRLVDGDGRRRGFPCRWPPGPSDRDAWRAILAADPELAPALVPDVRRVADGIRPVLDRSAVVAAARRAAREDGFFFQPCEACTAEGEDRWLVGDVCMSEDGLRTWLDVHESAGAPYDARADRLRALGNACVPAVAEAAFVELWHRAGLLTGF